MRDDKSADLIGIDTVKLGGKHFTYLVNEGDKVKKGQPLIRFELEAIKALHAFEQKTGALSAALVAVEGTVIAHTNVALAGTRLKRPLCRRAACRPPPFSGAPT